MRREDGKVSVERKGCQSGEVEDVEHLLLRCTDMAEKTEKLMRLMKDKVVELQHMEDWERVTELLDYACRNGGVGRSGFGGRNFVTNA